jgi:hypothetical protein
VSQVLSGLLEQFSVEDIAVEDPPLEEVIAAMFSRVSENDHEAAKSGDAK